MRFLSHALVAACSYNTLAMQLVERREFDEAYELLKKAEVLTDDGGCLADDDARRLRLSAVTFNNMGCFFKRRSKLHAALQYLFRALEVELQTEAAENPAATHLNICATFSQMGRHEEALEHAEKAIMQLQAEWDSSDNPTQDHPTNKSFLAMAYHNLAVEQEYLHYWEEARRSYEHAHSLAEQAWGASSPMTTALHKSWMGFQRKKKIAEKKEAEAAVRELSSRTARAGISGQIGGGGGRGGGGGGGSSRPQSAVPGGRQGLHASREPGPQQYGLAAAQNNRHQRPSSAPMRRAPTAERSNVMGGTAEREIYTRREPAGAGVVATSHQRGSVSARGGGNGEPPLLTGNPTVLARPPLSARGQPRPHSQSPYLPMRKPKTTPRGSYTDRSARSEMSSDGRGGEFDPYTS